MTETAEKLKAQISALSREDREELLEFLEESLRLEHEAAWDAELERRWKQIERGEVVGIPVEQMAAELRKKYG